MRPITRKEILQHQSDRFWNLELVALKRKFVKTARDVKGKDIA